jgi:hypothetical protein
LSSRSVLKPPDQWQSGLAATKSWVLLGGNELRPSNRQKWQSLTACRLSCLDSDRHTATIFRMHSPTFDLQPHTVSNLFIQATLSFGLLGGRSRISPATGGGVTGTRVNVGAHCLMSATTTRTSTLKNRSILGTGTLLLSIQTGGRRRGRCRAS